MLSNFHAKVSIVVLSMTCSAFGQSSQEFDIYHLDHSKDGTEIHALENITGGEYWDVFYVNSNLDNERIANLYSLRPDEGDTETWQLLHSWEFDEDVVGFDILHTNAGVRLLVARIDNYYLLDLDTMEEELVLSLPSIYRTPPYGTMPRINLAIDLNDDGLMDLAIPDFDGYWIAYQMEDGSFSKVQKLPVRPGLVTGVAWSYRPREIYHVDFNGDRIKDLCFWDRGRFFVYHGTADGYSTETVKADLNLDLDVDENVIIGITFGGTSPSADDEGHRSRTLYQLSDLNSDDVIDAVVLQVEQKGIFDFRTTYTMHFGIIKDGRTTFNSEPDSFIGGSGTFGIEQITDINNDGNSDIVTSGAKISIGAIIRFFLTWSFSYRTEFYLMQDGEFQSKPNVTRKSKVKVDFSRRNVQGANQISTGDLNNDGQDELVMADFGADKLKIYYGIEGPKLFDKTPVEVDLGFKINGDLTISDLNNDELEDMTLARTDGVTYIISR